MSDVTDPFDVAVVLDLHARAHRLQLLLQVFRAQVVHVELERKLDVLKSNAIMSLQLLEQQDSALEARVSNLEDLRVDFLLFFVKESNHLHGEVSGETANALLQSEESLRLANIQD